MRVLLLLSQMPQDPASGAPRSMRTICEFLAAGGMDVRALATTVVEGSGEFDPCEHLRGMGVGDVALEGRGEVAGGHVLKFSSKGVHYELLNTVRKSARDWEQAFGVQFDALLERQLEGFGPQIVFTYGGTPADMRRRKRVRGAGAKIVFGLRNLNYMARGAFADVDAVLTGSRFVTERYRRQVGIESTPLPLPIDPVEVIAAEHERIFVTYINPSIEKGVFFAARLFEELSIRRPDVPVLVVESRGTAGMLVAAGAKGGFDLRRHENIMLGKPVAQPAEIYALARMVLVPSAWEEPAGRVAAEALLNGIPPVVGDRGGLAEVCAGGGLVLPLPADYTLQSREPVAKEAAEPWLEALLKLVDDEAHYTEASGRAAAAGQMYRTQMVAPRYCEYFQDVHEGKIPPPVS